MGENTKNDPDGTNLDWLHAAVSIQRWRCVKKRKPREWELEVPFRFIPDDGVPTPESIVSVYEEEDLFWGVGEAGRKARRDHIKGELQKGREFLHYVVLYASANGLMNRRKFRYLVPITVKLRGYERVEKADVDESFNERYDLLESDREKHPGEWILRDRNTEQRVLFTIPAGSSRSRQKKLISRAYDRMIELNRHVVAAPEGKHGPS